MDKINFGHYEDQNPTFRSYMEDSKNYFYSYFLKKF